MSIATIYATIWNEEVRLPYFIKHYRSRFPGCRIIFFDNKSTDNTAKIALDNDCIIVSFDTNNEIRDDVYKQNKNNCWRPWVINQSPWECWHHWSWTADNEVQYLKANPDIKIAVDQGKFSCGMVHFLNHGVYENRSVPNRLNSSSWGCDTDWCIVVDCDEFLEVDENLLINADFNIVKAYLYDMYGENNDIDTMDKGAGQTVKTLCWKAKEFNYIGYQEGAHVCHPQPVHGKNTQYNSSPIYGYHFKWISYEYVINRYRLFRTRDEKNFKQGFGIQAHFPDHEQLAYYNRLKENGIKVRKLPHE